jgi:hypothetical protein
MREPDRLVAALSHGRWQPLPEPPEEASVRSLHPRKGLKDLRCAPVRSAKSVWAQTLHLVPGLGPSYGNGAPVGRRGADVPAILKSRTFLHHLSGCEKGFGYCGLLPGNGLGGM